jgi:hypothetical protein
MAGDPLIIPLTLCQIGWVAVRACSLPGSIEWEDGTREQVRLDQMPGEFAGYPPGQHFKAVVVRDPADFRLLKATQIQRVEPLPRMSPEEFQDLLRRIPTTRSLPEADWSWQETSSKFVQVR